MAASKPKIIKDYEKIPDEVKEQIKLVYPLGFSKHLITFTNKNGIKQKGLPFETDEVYYLIRMTVVQAHEIIEDDDDFNDDGELKESVKVKYEEKYDDVDYLDLNDNEDNSFDLNDDEDE